METNHRKIIILRGIPGSGKSTYAKEMVAKGFKRVNKDEIRHMINSYSLDNADEPMINDIQGSIVATLMARGKNVVVDNTHAKERYYKDLLEEIRINQNIIKDRYEYEVITKVFDTPLEECLRRNALRPEPVFEEVIYKMHRQLFS